MKTTCECLVIGGGLAGSMAALRLAEAGRDVLLVERERGAHAKVCGEFLSAEAIGYLRSAGVDPVRLGGVPIERLRVSVGNRVVETRLPFQALALSRTVLDQALLARSEEQGCRVLSGTGVEQLTRGDSGWEAECEGGDSIHAAQVFLATGKHDLRGWARPAGVQNDLVGFKMHFHVDPTQASALNGVIEVFLFSNGYGGLTMVEDGAANLCLVIRRNVLRDSGGWDALLRGLLKANSHVAGLLAGARACWPRPLAISPIPYGYFARTSEAWVVGDQAAVIPSFTGDGMSIALHSGALAAAVYLDGGNPETYLRRLAEQLRPGMRVATAVSRIIVRRPAQWLAPALLNVMPPMLRWLAAATRIPATVGSPATLRPVLPP